MNIDEYIERVQQPDFGDEMNFQIKRENPGDGMTFSEDAFLGLMEQINRFVMARVASRWQQTGVPPTELLATVKLGWQAYEEDVLEIGLPWWNLVDGSHRTKGGS